MREKRHDGVIQTVKNTRVSVTDKYGATISRSLQVTGASSVANILVGLGKLGMGLLSLSLFTCVSAFYTFGMVLAKYFALAGIVKAKSIKAQYRYYTMSGLILIVSSVLYIAYSVRLFFYPANPVYHEYVAMAIAAFTFTELTLNIRGVIITRHNHDPLIHAIKMISLASSLICLVLTQTAILSFASLEVDQHPAANGFIGIIMGSLATLLGIFMIIRIKKIENGRNYGLVFRKVKRLMKKEALSLKLKPIRYEESEDGNCRLYVKCIGVALPGSFTLLQQMAESELSIKLIGR